MQWLRQYAGTQENKSRNHIGPDCSNT